MKISVLSAGIVAAFVTCAEAGNSVCASGLYAALAPLAAVPAAQAFCATRFPQHEKRGGQCKRVVSSSSKTTATTKAVTTSTTKKDKHDELLSTLLHAAPSIAKTFCSCIQPPKTSSTTKSTTKSTTTLTTPSTTPSTTRSTTPSTTPSTSTSTSSTPTSTSTSSTPTSTSTSSTSTSTTSSTTTSTTSSTTTSTTTSTTSSTSTTTTSSTTTPSTTTSSTTTSTTTTSTSTTTSSSTTTGPCACPTSINLKVSPPILPSGCDNISGTTCVARSNGSGNTCATVPDECNIECTSDAQCAASYGNGSICVNGFNCPGTSGRICAQEAAICSTPAARMFRKRK